MEMPLLIPYAVFVLTYLLNFQLEPVTPAETVKAALLKAGPIVYLEFYVVFLALFPEDRAQRVDKTKIMMTFASLLLSSLGDACIVVETLYFRGMFLFALAHLVRIIELCSVLKHMWNYDSTPAYMVFLLDSLREIIKTGLKELWSDISRGKRIFQHVMSLVGTLVVLLLFWVTPFVVQVYFLLLLGMASLQVVSYFKNSTPSTELGVIGGILFVLSDSLLAVCMMKKRSVTLAMMLYYTAQGALAASAIHSSSPKKE